MVGKGDNFRPIKDKEKFESEWDRIFGEKKKKKKTKKEPGWDANGSPIGDK